MATTLALAMRASMSAGGVVSGANDASKALDKMGRHAQQAARDMATLKGIAIGAVVAKGASMAADAFMSAGRAVVSYAAGVAGAVDQTSDLAQRLGMGVESLQALQMAAKLSGIDDATVALQKLTVAIGTAAENGKTEAFTKLGLDFQALQAMSPEEQFRAVQAAIAALPTPAERAAAAVSIFGKSGVELLPLMSQNLAEIEERMKRLGAVVGADQVEAIGDMNDALDLVKATFDGIIGTVVGNLAPIVESLAQELLGFVESFNAANADAGGIAGVLTDAVLDVADYLAGVFDNAIGSFSGFGVTMKEVGSVFEFVGNVFTAIAETLRAAFNMFEVAGNLMAVAIGKLLEGLGSWVSSDLEQFGKDMAANAEAQIKQNSAEGNQALANAGQAATRAIFGGNASEGGPEGPARRAVRAARDRMTPEAKAERDAARRAKEAEAKAARDAAAAKAKAERDAKAQADLAKKLAPVQKKMEDKQSEIDKIQAQKERVLGGKSNEALKANDIRSSEGMAQFIALATGREDPAIEENRKTNMKLEEIRAELRALAAEKVDILGAAA
jgi:hypothetical protein